MISGSVFKIGIGVVLAMLISLGGSVAWLNIAKAKVETQLAQEEARCAKLQGELANCTGNKATLETALDRQNDSLERIQLESDQIAERSNARAREAEQKLDAMIKADRHVSTTADAMNDWLQSLFYQNAGTEG